MHMKSYPTYLTNKHIELKYTMICDMKVTDKELKSNTNKHYIWMLIHLIIMECSSLIPTLTNDIRVIIVLVLCATMEEDFLRKLAIDISRKLPQVSPLELFIYSHPLENNVRRLLQLLVHIFLIVLLPPIIFKSGIPTPKNSLAISGASFSMHMLEPFWYSSHHHHVFKML